mgnify:CR=1 FL=1
MKITKEQLKNIVRETLQEESEYQTFFKKALEKAGKSIPSMSDEEKKAFFNKIEKTWKGRGQKSEGNAFGAAVAKAKKDGDDSFEVDGKEYKTERFGRGHEGPTFGSEEESVNEGVEPQIKKIAYFTGTRPEAVEDFVSKHALNITKLLKYVEKGGLPQRMELVSALAGRPNNPVQKKIIKMFKESVINEGPSTEEKRIAMLAVRKQAKYRNVSLEQAIQDQINALEDLKRDVKKGKLK